MNKNEIVTVLEELNKITGFRISLHDKDYHEIAAYPEKMNAFCARVSADGREHKMCMECDRAACLKAESNRETYIYKCRYGLTEAVSPLYNFGVLTGYLMMGQVAVSAGDKPMAAAALSALGASDDEISSCVDAIPLVDEKMVSSFVKIMTICAEYLTLSNAISSQKSTLAERAKKYINKNIEHKLGIADICRELDCSKSTLLTSFKRSFGITVNAYITERRLERAVALLSDDKKSINEIAYECGFADQSYFSKVFSKKFGETPSEYRSSVNQDK